MADFRMRRKPEHSEVRQLFLDRDRLSHLSGWDAGNRNMRHHGRSHWNADDFAAAVAEQDRILGGEE